MLSTRTDITIYDAINQQWLPMVERWKLNRMG